MAELFIALGFLSLIVLSLRTSKEEKPTPKRAPYKVETGKRNWKTDNTKKSIIDYENYIKSGAWLNNKARLNTLKADDYSCRMCKSPKNIHVHHIHYKSLGNETAKDLVTLCKLCHEHTHKVAGKGANHYPPLNHMD